MKRIVILCDGTWSGADARHPTNVVQLSRALRPMDTDDVAQVPIYIPGVGTGRRGVTKMSRLTDKFLGGAMGVGLMQNVAEAYLHLAFLYEPGDDIHVFGFSRGAFTARSLAGLIRSSGILSRDKLDRLPEVLERYRSRDPDTHPHTEESAGFRADVSPFVMTSERDRPTYEAEGQADPTLLRIGYLGVWDSVGALGIPSRFGVSRLWNAKYRFHDAALSSMVRSARHAVALDERRREFEPTLWTNLDILNDGHDAADPPYQERYFAGDHGSVGGGGEIEDLSSIALSWIMEGAEAQGLSFDPRPVEVIRSRHRPMGPLTNAARRKGGLFAEVMQRIGKDRPGPARLDGLHPSVLDRWAYETKEVDPMGYTTWPYRPPGLRPLERDIAAWHDARLLQPGGGDTRVT